MTAKLKQLATIISRAKLIKQLAALLTACETKTTIPILATVLLELRDGVLHLTATDLDVSLECQCEVETAGSPFAVAINARLLNSLVAKASNEIRLEIDGSRMRLSYDGMDSLLPFDEREHYPNVQRLDAGELAIPATILRSLIRQTSFAIDKEESRNVVVAALCRYRDGRIEMVANDPGRLAIVGVKGEHKPFMFVLPRKGITALYGILEGQDGNVLVAQNDNLLRFDVAGMVLTARKLSRDFPNIDFVLSKVQTTSEFTVKTAALKIMLDRMADFSDDHSSHLRMTVEPGSLTMQRISSERGEGKTRLAIEYAGEPVTIGVTRTFFLDAVRVVGTEDVVIKFSDPDSPIVVESNGYRSVIAPCHLK